MSHLDEHAFLAGANMPTDKQVERAARLIAAAKHGDMATWSHFIDQARAALVIYMNQTKIMIGR